MNPGAIAALLGFALGLFAGCVIRWGIGKASEAVDEHLADCSDEDDDFMAVADAVQDDLDEPVPFVPVEFPANETDRVWLHEIGVEL